MNAFNLRLATAYEMEPFDYFVANYSRDIADWEGMYTSSNIKTAEQ